MSCEPPIPVHENGRKREAIVGPSQFPVCRVETASKHESVLLVLDFQGRLVRLLPAILRFLVRPCPARHAACDSYALQCVCIIANYEALGIPTFVTRYNGKPVLINRSGNCEYRCSWDRSLSLTVMSVWHFQISMYWLEECTTPEYRFTCRVHVLPCRVSFPPTLMSVFLIRRSRQWSRVVGLSPTYVTMAALQSIVRVRK